MFRKRAFWIVLIVLLLVFAGGGYFYYNSVYLQAQEPAEEPQLATAQATRGDLVITASGSGSLVPAAEMALGFRSSGVLAEVLVEVGDEVEAGQILARLDDADARDQVAQSEISLRQAELDLAELTEEADAAALAAAQASLSSAKADLTALTSPPDDQDLLAAQESLKSAKEALDDLLAGPDPDEVDVVKAELTLAEMNLRTAQAAYDKIAWQDNVGSSQEAADLWQATTNYEQAKAEYLEAQEGATADEISDARAQVAQAQAQLDALLEAPDGDEIAAAEAKVTQAQIELDDLLAGASAKDLEMAELNVAQARLNLESAQRSLEDAYLVAPMAGTVTAVEGATGESVGSESLITLADLDEPQVQFWVEEADLASVAPGNAVNIVFEALPDYTFPGQIISVDPMLVEVDGTPAVQSYASVDLASHPTTLLSGMNAEVEIVAGEALNAVLVPLQALRELGPESYAVFVVQEDDELEMRVVQVGLRDFVNAEIISGLEPGDVVSIGEETSSDSTTPATDEEQAPPPGMMRFFGG
ncbi:MAG: efflux RND transporter periplasmic adaptor subunit [Anaerolineae bacterium]|jgi:RND family efflux transporter MFP subunit